MKPLPDRERRHRLQFLFLNAMEYRRRLAASAALCLTGLGLQILWTAAPIVVAFLTVPLLLAGTLLLAVRGFDLEPDGSSATGSWERTTRERFAGARSHQRAVERWDSTFADITCPGGAALFFLTGGIVFVLYLFLAATADPRWGFYFAFDAVALLAPHWVTGTRRGWRPVGLARQIEALEVALAALEDRDRPATQVQPMFEMAGEGDRRTPVQARVFIRFPDAPEEFLGLQFQVSLNNVQGTYYPYLYAVVIARPSFGLLGQALDVIAVNCPGLTVEASPSEDAQAVVIRQPTTPTSGYHTAPPAIRAIALAAWASCVAVLATSASV